MNTESIIQPDPEIKGERGPAMKGADVLVAALEREGVDTIFAYPGGASMELHQALTRSEKIRTILPRQEQGGGFMAHGYARATGRAGVCMATSGPGATNLVTCIADAYMYSIPMIAITGQVYQEFIGKAAFQETDFFNDMINLFGTETFHITLKMIAKSTTSPIASACCQIREN